MTDNVKKLAAMRAELDKVIAGYDHIKDRLLVALLAGGHPLLRAVPGTAKTTMAKTLKSTVSDAVYARYQMTPDMKPSDIIGVEIYNQKTGDYKTKKGAIIDANFTLLDEINRTTPKTLSATLQPMQEKIVTIGDTTYDLKELLFFIATMNPIEQEGTFSLPEATVDRFMMLLDMRYVSRNDEKKMLRMHVEGTETKVKAVVSVAELLAMREEIAEILRNVSETALDYIVDLARATRPEDEKFAEVHDKPHPEELRILAERGEQPLTVDMLKEIIKLGGSPRTEIWTLRGAAALAYMSGAKNIEPDHVKAIFRDVARGRIIISPHMEFEGYTADKVIDAVLARVPVIR